MAAAIAKEKYPDFSTDTDFAKFKLIFEGKTIFINSYTVSEMSPVFAAMFFNAGFDEKKEQMAHIKEDKYDEALEMFRCLLPCSMTRKEKKPITIANLCELLKLSDKYQIEILKTYCEIFVNEELPNYKIANDVLIQMLQSAVDYNLNKESLVKIIERVATLPTKILEESKIAGALPGQIVGDLLFTKLRMENSKNPYQPQRSKPPRTVTTPAEVQYPDFSKETEFAKFKLIVEEKTIFINPFTIAEMSPVFAIMFFNERFGEHKEQMAHIKEDKYDEVVEMFRCLLPCSLIRKEKKPITMSNVRSLLKLSHKYEIKILKTYCEIFVNEQFQKHTIEDRDLIQILQSAVDYNLNKESLTTIIGRVAMLSSKILKESKIVNTLPGQIVGALLFTQMQWLESCLEKHYFFQANGIEASYSAVCSSCRANTNCVRCAMCSQHFCVAHKSANCPAANRQVLPHGKIDSSLLD